MLDIAREDCIEQSSAEILDGAHLGRSYAPLPQSAIYLGKEFVFFFGLERPRHVDEWRVALRRLEHPGMQALVSL